MRLWSLPMVVLSGFLGSGLASAAEVAPAMVAGNSVVFAPQQTPGGTMILRGSVPVKTGASSALSVQGQNPGPPTLSSSAATIGWDRAGLGPQ